MKRRRRTPFPILPLSIPRALDNVVSQNTCRLERVLDLHGCVDGGAFVGIELLACFGAGGEEDSMIICISFQLDIVVMEGSRDGW